MKTGERPENGALPSPSRITRHFFYDSSMYQTINPPSTPYAAYFVSVQNCSICSKDRPYDSGTIFRQKKKARIPRRAYTQNVRHCPKAPTRKRNVNLTTKFASQFA